MKKLFNLFAPPDATVLAQRELADAERALLTAQSNVEYATQMAAYHRNRVTRLLRYLNEVLV